MTEGSEKDKESKLKRVSFHGDLHNLRYEMLSNAAIIIIGIISTGLAFYDTIASECNSEQGRPNTLSTIIV
jgi:hypothetical protein